MSRGCLLFVLFVFPPLHSLDRSSSFLFPDDRKALDLLCMCLCVCVFLCWGRKRLVENEEWDNSVISTKEWSTSAISACTIMLGSGVIKYRFCSYVYNVYV